MVSVLGLATHNSSYDRSEIIVLPQAENVLEVWEARGEFEIRVNWPRYNLTLRVKCEDVVFLDRLLENSTGGYQDFRVRFLHGNGTASTW